MPFPNFNWTDGLKHTFIILTPYVWFCWKKEFLREWATTITKVYKGVRSHGE